MIRFSSFLNSTHFLPVCCVGVVGVGGVGRISIALDWQAGCPLLSGRDNERQPAEQQHTDISRHTASQTVGTRLGVGIFETEMLGELGGGWSGYQLSVTS